MSRFFLTIGIPASGKDTCYEKYGFKKNGFVHISSDLIRQELFGDINNQEHNDRVFEKMFKDTIAALNDGKDVYYNATNLNQKRRINLIKNLKQNLKQVCVFNCIIFPIPFKECLIRNEMRKRVVPRAAMERMYKSFQSPHYCEGWDYIYAVGSEEPLDIDKLFQEAILIPHDNPHHSLTIGQHMKRAQTLYTIDHLCNSNWIVKTALLYHDIGKPKCKVFHNMKGVPTDYAHYYCHENVGSYIILAAMVRLNKLHLVPDQIIEVSNLVAHHMDKFKSEIYCNKIRALYGEPFYKDLEIINKYDKLAH